MLPLFLIRLSKSEKEVLFYMTITSKEVAEMLGKRHDNLLRAIRKYITQLGDEAPKYFSEDPDKGGRLYHITKAGCDLMAAGADSDRLPYDSPFFQYNGAAADPCVEKEMTACLPVSDSRSASHFVLVPSHSPLVN